MAAQGGSEASRSPITRVASPAVGSSDAARDKVGELESDDGGHRQVVMRLLDHAVFHIVMGVVICLNVLVVAQETNYVVSCRNDEEEACEEGFHLIRLANVGFICIYGVETCLRFYAMGLKPFTRQWLNVMDVFVIIMGTFEIASSFLMESVGVDLNVQLLRIFRALRLVRSLRLLLWIVELYQLVAGFFAAAIALFWGSIMLIILIFLFAIMAVEFIHPRNKTLENVHEVDYCKDAFSSVQLTMLYFWQSVVATDAWGDCAITIVRAFPEAGAYFMFVLTVVQMGFANLVAAVIVDAATEWRSAFEADKVAGRKSNRVNEMSFVEKLMNDADKDGDGTMTHDELIEHYRSNEELRNILICWDIDEPSLHDLYTLIDRKGTGEVPIAAVVDEIRKILLQDEREQQAAIHMSLSSLLGEVRTLRHLASLEVQDDDDSGDLEFSFEAESEMTTDSNMFSFTFTGTDMGTYSMEDLTGTSSTYATPARRQLSLRSTDRNYSEELPVSESQELSESRRSFQENSEESAPAATMQMAL